MPDVNTRYDLTFVTDAFIRVHHILTRGRCSGLPFTSGILRQLNELSEIALTGHPDPESIDSVIRELRHEKFRVVRESGRQSPVAADIQSAIGVLKEMKGRIQIFIPKQPEETGISSWFSRRWERGTYSHCFSMIALGPVVIILTVLLVLSGVSVILNLSILLIYISVFVVVSILVKDVVVLGYSLFYLIPLLYLFICTVNH